MLQEGRDWSHCPATHLSLFVPTKSPSSHTTVATVPSDKSARLNVTDASEIASSMFQQFTAKNVVKSGGWYLVRKCVLIKRGYKPIAISSITTTFIPFLYNPHNIPGRLQRPLASKVREFLVIHSPEFLSISPYLFPPPFREMFK